MIKKNKTENDLRALDLFVDEIEETTNIRGITTISVNNLEDFEWKKISRKCKISKEFVEKYKDKVDWEEIAKTQNHLPINLIFNNWDRIIKIYSLRGYKYTSIIWIQLAKWRKFNEEDLDLFVDKYVSIYYYKKKYIDNCLNEDKNFWFNICYYQKWPENLLIKYRDYLDWIVIINRQHISNTFIYTWGKMIGDYKDKNLSTHPFITMPFCIGRNLL